MNRSLFPTSRKTVAALAFGSVLFTQSLSRAIAAPEAAAVVPRLPSTPVEPVDARKLLKLAQTSNICALPLDLKVENATLEDVVARVRKVTVSATSPTPTRIETRNTLLVRLSFAVKGSTVGGVLSSAGALAGARLWVFTDYLLLAPEEALSPEERVAIQKETATQWKSTNSTGRYFTFGTSKHRAFSSFIADEIKASPLTTTVAPTATPTGSTFSRVRSSTGTTVVTERPATEKGTVQTLGMRIRLSDLSPESQAMLRQLVEDSNNWRAQRPSLPGFPSSPTRPWSLSSDTTVEVNSDDNGRLQINVPQRGNMHWNLAGNGWGFSSGGSSSRPTSPTAPSTTTVPFLDPSAGKS